MRRIRIAFLAGDGGDVDDAAVVLLHHERHDGAATVEGAVEIDVDDLAPGVQRIVDRRHGRAGDACAVHEDVDAAELLVRLRGGGLHRGGIADVDGDFRTEIVSSVNDYAGALGCPATDPLFPRAMFSTAHGVVVLRDEMDRWAASRPVWNQHAYHVTHVGDRGEIVGELVLAIKLGTPLKTLADVIHPFPAFNRVLGASLEALAAKAAR